MLLVLGIVVSSSYAIGRIQQWYLHGIRRDEAYRTGYDRATNLMFTIVADAKTPSKQGQKQQGQKQPAQKQPTQKAGHFFGRAKPLSASVPAQAGARSYRHVSGFIGRPPRTSDNSARHRSVAAGEPVGERTQ